MHSHVVRVHVIDDTLPCQTNVLKLLKCMCSLFVFVFGLRPAHTCHMQRYGRVMHDPIESCAIMRGMHRCTQVEQVPRPPPPVAGVLGGWRGQLIVCNFVDCRTHASSHDSMTMFAQFSRMQPRRPRRVDPLTFHQELEAFTPTAGHLLVISRRQNKKSGACALCHNDSNGPNRSHVKNLLIFHLSLFVGLVHEKSKCGWCGL